MTPESLNEVVPVFVMVSAWLLLVPSDWLAKVRDFWLKVAIAVVLVPVPFTMWRALALLAENLPRPPITRNQVELMKIDNIVSPACPGFAALGIQPQAIEVVLGNR